MLFPNRGVQDYTFEVKFLRAVIFFVVAVVGNDVFKCYHHRQLRISSTVCICAIIYTQENICYFSQCYGLKLWGIKKNVKFENGSNLFFLGFRKTSSSHANVVN